LCNKQQLLHTNFAGNSKELPVFFNQTTMFRLFFLIPLWGFLAHTNINSLAVNTLPEGMLGFYKHYAGWLADEAATPDKRRNATPGEAEKHYIDLDRFGTTNADSIPHLWVDAVAKFGEDSLHKNGMVPWVILGELKSLTEAMKKGDAESILRHSADLGHYVGDAHVPLHATSNYDGQLTGQKGIHALWETAIPEIFMDSFELFTGKATYLVDPSKAVWKAVAESYALVPNVLEAEKTVSATMPDDKKYTYRGSKRVYSDAFVRAYQAKMGNMVQERMRSSIALLGSLWYTAWVDAGQPHLVKLLGKEVPESEFGRKQEAHHD